MSAHHHPSIAHPGVQPHTRTDRIFDAYPGEAQPSVLGSAENLAVRLPTPAGSYVSASDRSGPNPGNYMSTRPSDARRGNYTSTDAPSDEVGSYIDVEPAR